MDRWQRSSSWLIDTGILQNWSFGVD